MKFAFLALGFLTLAACTSKPTVFSPAGEASSQSGDRDVAGKNMTFAMDCKIDNGGGRPRLGAPRYRIVKEAFKENGKWSEKFSIDIIPQNPMAEPIHVPLVAAGSGDEDYDEFKTVGKSPNVQGASIQNQFKWANLIDGKGVNFARCSR